MSADGKNGYFVEYGSGVLSLFVENAGTFTQLGTYADATIGTKHVKIEITNATKKVYLNNSVIINSTDNSITSIGSYALITWYSDIGGLGAIDNFAAASL